jgi:hypothetical protein
MGAARSQQAAETEDGTAAFLFFLLRGPIGRLLLAGPPRRPS